MKKNSFIFALSLLSVAFTSCDDGLIYEKLPEISHEGFNVKLTGKIDGIDQWNDPYSVVLAGFGDSRYAIVQKQIPIAEEEEIQMTLSDISSEVKTIELCVTNKLRERIITFRTIEMTDIEDARDTVLMDVGTVDAGIYTAIQQHIFNTTCAACHGGRETAAAGLYLTDGRSHDALVNQPSSRVENGTLVIPGDAENSVLHKVVNEGNAAHLSFSHENMIASSALLKLIDNWINDGAKN